MCDSITTNTLGYESDRKQGAMSRLISPNEMVMKIASGEVTVIDTQCERTGKSLDIVRSVNDYDYFASVKSDGAESSVYLKII